MNFNVTLDLWKKGKWFIAKCPELDFVSQGKSEEEAKKNLLEVIQIQFEEMTEMGTLNEYLSECGFRKNETGFVPLFQKIRSEAFQFEAA